MTNPVAMTMRLTAAVLMVAACTAMAADSYPTRPIRVVDPFSPGGSTEAQARAVGTKLTEVWGQPVVIDARPGAGSSLGSQVVAQAAPDGYTLLVNNVGLVTSAIIAKKPPFDPLRDFAPVIMVGTQAQFIVVHPSLPATLKEFLQYAKANPGKVNYGSSGVGGSSHLSIEYLKMFAGIDVVHVPYKGSAPSATAIMAGEIQLGSFAGNSVLPHIRSGKLRALAVTTLKRSAVMPEVPTASEAGLPGYEVITWGGIFAPARTPTAIVTKLNEQMNVALQTADVKERYARIGVEPAGGPPQVLSKLLASEVRKWTKVIADAGIPKE
ncbi:MAG: Bug family tripartite tricarboxylate transporter substrate binding protein [Burkholderiales bacterium]